MIREQLLDQRQWDVKCPYPMNPIGFCLHNTDNSATAQNERDNLNRVDNRAFVSFHNVTDNKETIRCIPYNRNAWASGDGENGEGNRHYIHWEIAQNFCDDETFRQAQENAAKDMASELIRLGWDINRITTLKRHKDFSGKNCPSRTDIYKFKEKVKFYMTGAIPNIPPSPQPNTGIKVGDMVRPTGNKYATGETIPSSVKEKFYKVIQVANNKVLLADIISWVYSGEVTKQNAPQPNNGIIVGDLVKPIGTKYATGQPIPSWVKEKYYRVNEVRGNQVLLAEINSLVFINEVVEKGATTIVQPQPTTPSKTYLNLDKSVPSWRIYKQDGPYTIANAIATLSPSKYNGLSYEILGSVVGVNNVYLIRTGMFGVVAIYAPKGDKDCSFTNSPIYN